MKCENFYSEINEYQPMDFPNRPSELENFYGLSKEQQWRISLEFFKRDYIKEYLDLKWDAERYNRDNFYRLYELLKSEEEWPFGSGKNAVDKEAIKAKLTQFRKKIQSNQHPYEALMIDFKKFPFDERKENQETEWNE